MSRSTRSLALAGTLGLLVAVSAVPTAAAENARVRVLHASPDAPAVDVYVDDQPVDALTGVPFGTISDYLTIPAGDHNVKVYPTGDTSTAVIDADVTFASGSRSTVAAVGEVAAIEPVVLSDDARPTSDAAVRIVHLSPDAPEVDIAPDGAPAADAIVSDLAFPTDTGYLDIPAGSYDLDVRLAGTDTVALDLDPVAVEAGTAYSVFAIGSAAPEPLGGNPLAVLVAVDRQGMPDTSTLGDTAPAAGVGTAALVALLAAAAVVVRFRGRLGGVPAR